MTPQQKKFVNAYFLHNGNQRKAAEIAGYSDPDGNAWRIVKHPEVKTEIARRLDEMAMPANEVLARLADHARSSLEDFLDISESGYPNINLAKGIEAGKGHLIKSLKPGEFGVEIELVDTQGALVQLGRYHKLFTDKVQHSGAIRTEGVDLSRLSDAEMEAMEALLEKAAVRDTETHQKPSKAVQPGPQQPG